MSLADNVKAVFDTLDTSVDTLVSKAQALLDTTESMSDEDGQLLLSVKDDMVRLDGIVQAMIIKIQARLDS